MEIGILHYRKDTNNKITDLTKFTFIANSCTVPEDVRKKYNLVVLNLFGREHLIKLKEEYINTYEKGGLNMVDIDIYLK